MGKKVNAVLGLAIIAAFLVHILYEIISFLTFYYNPSVTKTIANIVAPMTIAHIIISAVIVFIAHDKGNGLRYPKLNVRTIIQRISAVIMVLLLPVHFQTFGMLQRSAEDGRAGFIALIALQILFYGIVLTHVAVSTGNAFITLGLIDTEQKRRRLDVAIWIICAVLFVAASVVIVRTELIMFSPAATGGAS
ncbi:hypothetical protein SAMN02910456_01341 [Ruminococcaceae bacterium YRB3002]|nr:hypothetical protein SAMN02910456_01341 [Ruminococcaceae bacterium YRB3002]